MPAPAISLDLVERFHQHLAAYKQNSYNDYVTRQDEIAGIFVREAFLKGAFDQYAVPTFQS